jgi:hypothetical protein
VPAELIGDLRVGGSGGLPRQPLIGLLGEASEWVSASVLGFVRPSMRASQT